MNLDTYIRTVPMSDELKLELAREIYPDSKRARKESFTSTQWAGVERAWAWVVETFDVPPEPMTLEETIARVRTCTGMDDAARGVPDAPMTATAMHYQPKEPTVKQEPWTVDDPHATEIYQDDKILRWRSGSGRTMFIRKDDFKMSNPPTYKGVPLIGGTRLDDLPEAHASEFTPPWTEAQREAAESVYNRILERGSGDDDGRLGGWGALCAAIAKVAHLWQPAPSPAPAGVPDVWSVDDQLYKTMRALGWETEQMERVPVRLMTEAILRHFAPALRTRDERIAELERERDELLAKMSAHLEHHIQGADSMQNHMDTLRATIATLTKERDEASAKIDKMHPRLDGLADFYKCAREVCDGFNTDKPLAEALRLLRSGYDNVCEDAKTLRARVAELERIIRDVRQATPTSDDSNWNGDPQGLANEVGNRFRELQDRVAELEKRGAVTGEQLHAAALPTWGYLTTWDKTGNKASWNEIAERLNLQSRDVRRITRDEVDRATHTWYDERRVNESPLQWMERALRAIGFEVEA